MVYHYLVLHSLLSGTAFQPMEIGRWQRQRWAFSRVAQEMVSERLYSLSITNFHDSIVVPVVAIFTKMDALDGKAFIELISNGDSFKDAMEKAPSYAKAMFERDYLERLNEVDHPPAAVVQLRGTSSISIPLLLSQPLFTQIWISQKRIATILFQVQPWPSTGKPWNYCYFQHNEIVSNLASRIPLESASHLSLW